MEWITLYLFVPACFALNLTPGPNNLLAMSNARGYGIRTAFLAGGGRLLAFAGMIALAASGLASILYASEQFFVAVKLAGAGYLLWMAYQLWRAVPSEASAPVAGGNSLGRLARQEFLLAAGNPKAILIFTAFLPQFVDPARPMLAQFAILGALFLLLEWVAIALYASCGVYLRNWFASRSGQRIFNRGCAGLLAAAGVGLLFARR